VTSKIDQFAQCVNFGCVLGKRAVNNNMISFGGAIYMNGLYYLTLWYDVTTLLIRRQQ